MTDQEYITEIRRGLIIIMRAMMRRYGLSWADFQPRERRDENAIIRALIDNQTPALPLAPKLER